MRSSAAIADSEALDPESAGERRSSRSPGPVCFPACAARFAEVRRGRGAGAEPLPFRRDRLQCPSDERLPRARLHGRRGAAHVRGLRGQVPRPQRAARAGREVARRRQVEREFWREAGQAGLLGVSVPADYGGGGGDFRHDVVVAETDDPQGRRGLRRRAAQRHHHPLHPGARHRGAEAEMAALARRTASGSRRSR